MLMDEYFLKFTLSYCSCVCDMLNVILKCALASYLLFMFDMYMFRGMQYMSMCSMFDYIYLWCLSSITKKGEIEASRPPVLILVINDKR